MLGVEIHPWILKDFYRITKIGLFVYDVLFKEGKNPNNQKYIKGITGKSGVIVKTILVIYIILLIVFYLVGITVDFLEMAGVMSLKELIKDMSFYELDTEKYKGIISKYMSYYNVFDSKYERDIINKEENYPTSKFHIVKHKYNDHQLLYWFNLLDLSLTDNEISMLKKINKNYLTINPTNIQKELLLKVENYLMISNLIFKNKRKIVYPNKFKKIYKKIHNNNLRSIPDKTIIYSNFYEGGILQFKKYLDSVNFKSYKVLSNNISVEKKERIVKAFNNNKFKIILLHPSYIEGISLFEVRQFHILEVISNISKIEQIKARAIRFQSHIKLLEDQRHVDIYMHITDANNNIKIDFQDWYEKQYEKAFIPIVPKIIQRLYGLIPTMTFHRERQKHFKSADRILYERFIKMSDNIIKFNSAVKQYSIENKKNILDELTREEDAEDKREQENLT